MADGYPACFIGGVADGQRAELSAVPARVVIAAQVYHRLDDPDTGEYLGGYFARMMGCMDEPYRR